MMRYLQMWVRVLKTVLRKVLRLKVSMQSNRNVLNLWLQFIQVLGSRRISGI